MPYVRDGKCVYHKNPDGSKGKLRGCSESVEMAKKYMQALYANEKSQAAFAEMSMSIVKAAVSNKDGAMRLNLVNSDTGEDVFGERMSLELFNDFINRAENDVPIPEPFKDVVEKGELGYWNGGPPYLSISHYRSGGGKNIPGEQEVIYLDGDKLKSKDILYDNPLGRAVWKSVHNDLYEEKKDYPDKPVRVSIGFLDFEHKHVSEDSNEPDYIFTRSTLDDTCPMCNEGVGGKVYLKGHLVHKAFTRVPAHPRTLVEMDMTEKSDDIISKKEDAESIIDDLAEELVGKSAYEDMLVVKANESRDEDVETNEITSDEPVEENSDSQLKPEDDMDEETKVQEEVVEEEVPATEEVKEEPVVVEESQADKAVKALMDKIAALKGEGKYGDAGLREIQEEFNALGEVVKNELATPAGQVDLAAVLKSAVAEAIPAMKSEIVAEVVKQLKGYVAPTQETPVDAFVPRSLTPANLTPVGEDKRTQIEKIANASVGLK